VKRIILEEVNIKKYVEQEKSGDLEVMLDTTMTPELLEEGMKREVIRAIQQLRKKQGFSVSDEIKVTLPKKYESISRELLDSIQKDTATKEILWGDTDDILISIQ